MKLIKRVIILIIVAIISVVAYLGYQGYDMYKNALEEEPLSEREANIKEKENYTKLEEMPDIY